MAQTQSDLMSLDSNSLRTPPRRTSDTSAASVDPETPTSRAPSSSQRGRGRRSGRGRGRGGRFAGPRRFDSSWYCEGMLPFIVPHIREYTDVVADGNCGYRCIALAIYGDDNEWGRVRNDLCHEIKSNPDIYRRVISYIEHIGSLYSRIAHYQSPCLQEFWMELPDVGHVIATCYNVILHSFGASGLSSVTCFPANDPLDRGPPTNTIVLGFVNGNHFILLHMEDDSFPVPRPALYWEQHHDHSRPYLTALRSQYAPRMDTFVDNCRQAYADQAINL